MCKVPASGATLGCLVMLVVWILPTLVLVASIPRPEPAKPGFFAPCEPLEPGRYALDEMVCKGVAYKSGSSGRMVEGPWMNLLGYRFNNEDKPLEYSFDATGEQYQMDPKWNKPTDILHGILEERWSHEKPPLPPANLRLSGEFKRAVWSRFKAAVPEIPAESVFSYLDLGKPLAEENGTLSAGAGVFFYQARAECELNETTSKDGGQSKQILMEFRIFSGLMKFEVPPAGSCVPKFGRIPFVNDYTNTSRLDDYNELEKQGSFSGATYFLDIEATLTWDKTAGPQLPRGFQIAGKLGNSESDYWNKEVIEKNPVFRRIREGAPKGQGLNFRFPAGLYQEDKRVFRINDNTYANLYQEVAICGPFRVRSSYVNARVYNEKNKTCIGEGEGALQEWNGNYHIEDVDVDVAKCGECPELDQCEKKEQLPVDCQVNCGGDGVNKILKLSEFLL